MASASVVIMPARTFGRRASTSAAAALTGGRSSAPRPRRRAARTLGELLARADCSPQAVAHDANSGDAACSRARRLRPQPAASLEELTSSSRALGGVRGAARPAGARRRRRRLTLRATRSATRRPPRSAAASLPRRRSRPRRSAHSARRRWHVGAAARWRARRAAHAPRVSNASIGGGGERAAAALRFLLEALPSPYRSGLRSAASPRRLRAAAGDRAAAALGRRRRRRRRRRRAEIGATALEELVANAELGDGGGIAIADGVRGGALRERSAPPAARWRRRPRLAAAAPFVVLTSARAWARRRRPRVAVAVVGRLFDNPAIGAGARRRSSPRLPRRSALESSTSACALARRRSSLCAALRDERRRRADARALRQRGARGKGRARRGARRGGLVAWREAEREGDVKA